MDKASIQQFSDTLREKLVSETQKRAAFYGIHPDAIKEIDQEFEDSIVIAGKVFNKKIKKQREQLIQEIREKGYTQVIDEVTYTWFNRFIALKFMEVNGYLPIKVFSSASAGKTEPDILTNVLNLNFLALDRDIILDFKSKGKDEELYKYLILHLCNYLHEKMPFLFEVLEDYSELLFPERLLHTDSILGDLNTIIDEADWKEVEIIGWIYQDYIAQKKEALILAKKQYTPNQVATVTQLFTPKWIVKYMVQNSLGRYWLESHPNRELQNQFEFFLEHREQDYQKKLAQSVNKNLLVEEIKFIDPAMGSGHILVYAFEVFFEIYKKCGYSIDQIPELILTKNLFGLEIDERATQLASFALLMKARQYDKKIFDKKVELNLIAFKETNNFSDEDILLFAGNKIDYEELKKTIELFKNAKTLGSIIKTDTINIDLFEEKLKIFEKVPSLRKYEILDDLKIVLKQTKLTRQKYDISVANPPYLNRGKMPDILKRYVEFHYPISKYDLFSVFTETMCVLTKPEGHIGIMCPFVWMFIDTFSDFRRYLIDNKCISSLIELEYHAIYDVAVVPVCSFTVRNFRNPISGEYIKLSDFKGSENQPIKVIESIRNPNIDYRYTAFSQNFSQIPGCPIAYWASEKLYAIFENSKNLGEIAEGRSGLMSGDDEVFLRFWHEVNCQKIGFNHKESADIKRYNKKWFPLNKGGKFRKWYGNLEYVINLENDGYDIKNHGKNYRLRDPKIYFKKGITWSRISAGIISFRFKEEGVLFSDNGPCTLIDNPNIDYYLGLLNTKIVSNILKILSPTLTFQARDISLIPVVPITKEKMVCHISQRCISITKEEWDLRETSWNFKTNELVKCLNSSKNVADAYFNYCAKWNQLFTILHTQEEELNRIFIEIYDLSAEMTHHIPLEEISLLRDDADVINGKLVFDKTSIIKQFISYAVGCIFGRYSPDKEGLILANQGESIEDFNKLIPHASFIPDDDNIIPILDDEYFSDDIVTKFKEFLKVTFGEDSLAKNLEFIAGALSPNGSSSPEKTIRNYFLKSFFKDHVQMYKGRPIYWLFTSGENQAFNALIYMHRYEKSTLAKMRTDYLLELESKLDANLNMLSSDPVRNKTKITNLRKQIEELKAYDELLNNKALALINIDLDDGVVTNYNKFEGLVKTI